MSTLPTTDHLMHEHIYLGAAHDENARKAVQEKVVFPPGTYAVWSGQFEYLERARRPS